MKHLAVARTYLVVLALAALSGCAALGLPTADTFNQRLAAAYGLVTTVRTSATQLLESKAITAGDGQNVLNTTDAARAGLDTARTIAKVDPAAADAKLTAVRTALVALQTYLATKKGS